jgi:hypothetical protein
LRGPNLKRENSDRHHAQLSGRSAGSQEVIGEADREADVFGPAAKYALSAWIR